jgi:hypothetical protein
MIIDMEDLLIGLDMLALDLHEVHLQVLPNGPSGSNGVACFVNWVATKEEVLGFKQADVGECIDIALPDRDEWLELNEISTKWIEKIHDDALIDLRYILCTGMI